MLVITRYHGERLLLTREDEIIGIIEVADVKGDRVKVALDLHPSIRVQREEVVENAAHRAYLDAVAI